MRASSDDLIARFHDACSADERIVAAFIGGSMARGQADRYSDLDLCVVVDDAAFDEVIADRAPLVGNLGTPLLLELEGDDEPVAFVMLADGNDIEVTFVRESRLNETEVGPIRPLFDRRGLLDELDVPIREPSTGDVVEDLRRTLVWFWHDLGHFVTAAGRSQTWWAAGQVEALRGYCVNLVRVEQGLRSESEPYWKIDAETSTDALEELRSTFVGPDIDGMVDAASHLVGFFGVHGRRAADAYRLEYPDELERLMRRRLGDVIASPGA
jgi:predicted nucleotidyltransferase